VVQRWEYHTVQRDRGWVGEKHNWFSKASDWDIPIEEILALGQEGWELVSVVPMSSYVTKPGDPANDNVTGFTSQQEWVFKRPLEP
jgi:hypothetical protein